jgi:hypothetical protein
VAAGSREIYDEPDLDRVGHGDHDNGNRRGSALDGLHFSSPRRHDDIGAELHEFQGEPWKSFVLSLCEPRHDDEILPLDVPQITQGSPEGLVVIAWSLPRREISEAPLPRRVLCLRRGW